MSALRLDQLLASAAVSFILAGPISALGQTEPSTSPPANAVQAPAPAPALEKNQPPDGLALLDPADRQIAERIRDLLDAKPNRIFSDETVRAALEVFYQKRNLAPLWLDKGVANGRSKAVIARLKNADADGLDHADYKTPALNGLSPEGLAEAELTLTQALLTYARHLQAGRIPHRQVREDNIALPQRAPDPAVVLAAVAEADDAGQALEQFSPPYENYQKLKAALAQLRGRAAGGSHDQRRIDTIIANMERWRWYHREIRKSRVEVNEPDFRLKVIHDGRQVWATRVVIGKPSMPSPLLAQQMDSITINPTWKVPASIVRNEYLPAEARQPGTLARMGMRMKRVNGEVEITMPPGGQNPLGHIRFNFFNRLTVFQHDTPDQYLFAHVVRAESHGCMRVQDAPKYAELLASIVHPEEQWTAQKVKSLYADSPEHEISLGSGPIWIYLTYQTAFVDEAGKLQIRRDLYNLDSRTLAAIKVARASGNSELDSKSEPKIAMPAPAASAHRRKAARMDQHRS
jgi:L,D-transpeptidase YcbB